MALYFLDIFPVIYTYSPFVRFHDRDYDETFTADVKEYLRKKRVANLPTHNPSWNILMISIDNLISTCNPSNAAGFA